MALHMNSLTPKNNNVLLLTWGQTMSQVLKFPIIGLKMFSLDFWSKMGFNFKVHWRKENINMQLIGCLFLGLHLNSPWDRCAFASIFALH
jgi:hypothetical protein